MRYILLVVVVGGVLTAMYVTGAEERGPIPGVDTEPLYIIPHDLRLQYPSKTDRELRMMLHEGQERIRRWTRDIIERGRTPSVPTSPPKPSGPANVRGGLAEGEFWPAPDKDASPFTLVIQPAGQGKVYYLVYMYSANRWQYRGQPRVVNLPPAER